MVRPLAYISQLAASAIPAATATAAAARGFILLHGMKGQELTEAQTYRSSLGRAPLTASICGKAMCMCKAKGPYSICSRWEEQKKKRKRGKRKRKVAGRHRVPIRISPFGHGSTTSTR
jgi:hypothetical protein